MAMTLVSTVTVGSGGAASISFSGIAATGKDLRILLSSRNAVNETGIALQFNSDTANNYQYRMLYGDGSSATSQVDSDGINRIVSYTNAILNNTANTFSSVEYYISNYAASASKIVSIDGVIETNSSTAYQSIVAGRWTGTAAITSLTLTALGTNPSFVQNTTASLYIIS
jgi:hypothetical protein